MTFFFPPTVFARNLVCLARKLCIFPFSFPLLFHKCGKDCGNMERKMEKGKKPLEICIADLEIRLYAMLPIQQSWSDSAT